MLANLSNHDLVDGPFEAGSMFGPFGVFLVVLVVATADSAVFMLASGFGDELHEIVFTIS